MKHRFPMKLMSALILAVVSGAAYASGFQLMEQNASGIGNAFAGSAAVGENASTIYYNPAAMTRLQAHEASIGLVALKPSLRFKDQGSSVGLLAGAGNGGDAGDWAYVPNVYAAWAVNKDIYLGLGISSPFGLKSDYKDRWLGAAQSQLYEVKTININPSLAWRATDKVSLGFGLNWQKVDAKYHRLAGAYALGPLQMDRIKAKAEFDDDAWGWNGGVLFELSPTMRVGLSYRSRIKYHTSGDIKLHSDGSAVGNATLAALTAMSAQSNIKGNITLPDSFIISVAQNLSNRWEMLGDLSWTGWSSIPKFDLIRTSGVLNGTQAQRLDTNLRDTWRIALGANYKYNDQWKLKYGIAYDQTPVKRSETRLVQLPDNDRLWLSFGTQWMPNKGSRLDLGLAYLYVRDTRINKLVNTASQGYEGGRVTGKYDGSLWVFGAQYSQAF